MSLKKVPFPYLVLLLIPLFLTSCGQAAEINVPCDIVDLIDAINVANSNTDTTRLILAPNCTYQITGVDNTDGGAGPNGLPQITTNIRIEGNNATLTKQPAFGNRFFFITNSGNLVIEDLTLEKGYAFAGDFPETRGGAIYNVGALRAERSLFRDNHAQQGNGGAIYNLGLLVLKDDLFDINGSYNGGAIYNGGNQSSVFVIEDVAFENNMGLDNGGAIFNASGEADILISGSSFNSNRAYEFHGGAIYMEAGKLDIYNSDFMDNTSGSNSYPTGDGGAIYTLGGDVSVYNSVLLGSRAYGVGGMIYGGPGSTVKLKEIYSDVSDACHGGGTLYVEGETEILQSTIEDSRAGGISVYWNMSLYPLECLTANGGAIYNTGSLTLDQSLIDSFAAETDGHGIYNLGSLTIINSTFSSPSLFCNSREAINNHGSAKVSFTTFMRSSLSNNGTMEVKNIVVANCPSSCLNVGNLTATDENIALDSSCPFSIILTGFNDLKIDNYLSDNGGPTETHFVYDDSPVLEMATCSSVSGSQVFKDQRDLHRPYPLNGTCDIGAFEKREFSDQAPPPPPPPNGESSDCDPFAGMDIAVIMLNINPETLVFPVYLRFQDVIPETGEDGSIPYWGELGPMVSYLTNQQGFPDRWYFLFEFDEVAEGSVQDLEIFKEGCSDPVFIQPSLALPAIQRLPSEEKPSPTCKKDLGPRACDAAGGYYFTGVDDPFCVCP